MLMAIKSSTKILLISVFSLLILGACGKKHRHAVWRAGDYSREEADIALANSTMNCGISGGCDNTVALFTASKASDTPERFNLGLCTTFVIGDSLMATNAHCIPDELRFAGADCSRDIRVSFWNEEPLACNRILFSSQPGDDSAIRSDFAFFTVHGMSHRTPLVIGHSGFADNEAVKVLSVNPDLESHRLQGTLTQKTGRATYNTRPLSNFNAATYAFPLFAATASPVVHGNSGSPVFKSDGSVSAILFALISSTGDFVATSFACIDETNTSRPWVSGPTCPSSTR